MPRDAIETTLRDVPVLHVDDELGDAARRVIASGLPALPVVDRDERLVGIFGEREFIGAAMPGYVKTLPSAVFARRSLDDALEARGACVHERVGEHMNTEHVELPPDFSDIQVAETFLHHRVLGLPVIDEDRHVLGAVMRADFFRHVAGRVLGDDAG
jgi:CBS-domain-containing membrane protein